ncbi:hypothetical protein GQ44DRAFT_708003 [Phaeosphaeriaceae sp. PMI808]|nr:hypothetical protein GQ44DRAFT_708003 [Phaeosphaeriaceae sp. PMI808]
MTKIANKWLQYMKGRPWKTWAQWLVSGQEQRKKSHLDLWTDAMDWSQVEELRIDPIEDEVLEKLPGRLTGLRKLETANMSFLRAMKDNTLTQLTWIERSNSKNLPFLLEHQGISLQRLEFRCDELACPNFTPNFDISIIANMTRNLTHLSINVARNGTWPLETLQAIAKLQHLRSADLYFNIQSSCAQERESDYLHFLDENYCKEEDQFQRPFVDKEGAEELFSYMRKHSQGEELTHVTFWVGDWASPSDGLVHPPPWAQDRRSKITCSTEKKGKNDVRCVVESGDKYWEHKWAGGQYRKIVWAL